MAARDFSALATHFDAKFHAESEQPWETGVGALTSESCRLFHGRGRCYPGLEHLCIDWFEPAIVITLFADLGKVWEDGLVKYLSQTFTQASAIFVQKRYDRGHNLNYELRYREAPPNLFAQRK